jgi:hypothetical protein
MSPLIRLAALVPALVSALVLAPAAAHAAVIADWRLDESSGATTMVDSSQNGGLNNGKIVSVQTGVPGLAGGRAYQFNGSGSYVQVPDADALDPGTKPIILSAVVRIPDGAMKDDSYDLVRKGVSSTPGGNWKMEVNRRDSAPSVGRLRCVFKGVLDNGTKSEVMKIATPDIADGRVHRVQCIRTETAVRAVVDGRVFEKVQRSGSIVNSEPVMVGAKTPGDDVMLGVMDQVSISIG